jgi:hypothetical protein
MAKRKASKAFNESQFIRTAANLKKKGKTNKKLKRNPNAAKYDR